ncbi:unnamed protein product, partial [Scytosiphon promiscuus]
FYSNEVARESGERCSPGGPRNLVYNVYHGQTFPSLRWVWFVRIGPRSSSTKIEADSFSCGHFTYDTRTMLCSSFTRGCKSFHRVQMAETCRQQLAVTAFGWQ